jgi:gamma-glutamylcyclotransferase
MIYFAYGSNMDEARMRKRCPSARFLFKGRLPGFRLDFTRFSTTNQCGAADIIPDSSATVWGVVYHINDEHKPALEKAEGVPVRAYEQATLSVHPDGDDAQHIKVITYAVVTKETPCPKPSEEYKARIVNGAKSWKLPADYIAGLERIAVA